MTFEPFQVRFVGDDLLRVSGLARTERDALARHLREAEIWLEVVPGQADITVRFDALRDHPSSAEARLLSALQVRSDEVVSDQAVLEIPVCYAPPFGPDLTLVAATLGVSAEAVIARHTGSLHQVNFLGFVPGFAYLDSESSGLDVPRLPTPRTRLPAGSIGVANGMTGLYVLAGPGGWPIIGRSPMMLFDHRRASPSPLQPGLRVRFRSIDAAAFEAAMQ